MRRLTAKNKKKRRIVKQYAVFYFLFNNIIPRFFLSPFARNKGNIAPTKIVRKNIGCILLLKNSRLYITKKYLKNFKKGIDIHYYIIYNRIIKRKQTNGGN